MLLWFRVGRVGSLFEHLLPWLKIGLREKSGSLPTGRPMIKDELRTDGDPSVAYLEYCTKAAVAAPASTTLEFPGEQEMFPDMHLLMYPRRRKSGSKLTMVLILCNYTLLGL